MKSIRQLTRQPAKYLSGIAAVSLAVCILCVCLGQAIVAGKTAGALDDQFTTIALPTTKYHYSERTLTDPEGNPYTMVSWSTTLPEEIVNWVMDTVETRPDLVESLASPGLASAYIPELKPENLTDHPYDNPLVGSGLGVKIHDYCAETTYAGAMLEMILDEIGTPQVLSYPEVQADGSTIDVTIEVIVELKGTVKSVVSLEEGYDDPTGRTIYFTLHLPDQESLDALELQPGERYIVYGSDYLDGQWALRSDISRMLSQMTGSDVFLEELDDDCFSSYDESVFLEPDEGNAGLGFAAYYNASGNSIGLEKREIKQRNAVFLTAQDQSIFPTRAYAADENGGRYTLTWERWITDEEGNPVQISQEEYSERYSVPTIARLTGSVEDFLQTESGQRWADQLAVEEVNYQAFPMIGVEKLGHIAEFSRKNAGIVEGRDFSQSELSGGAKVCVISESLAAQNGLRVGDKITPRFYNYDWNSPYQGFLSEGYGVFRPMAYPYTKRTEFAGDGEEYEIVGLYRQNNPWDNAGENLFTFTPNTIFVPKASISSDMDYGDNGFFRTLVLKNGAVPEFRTLVDEAGYEDLFVYYDQGYTQISTSLHDYEGVARLALVIGIIVYGVILGLFLLLFPGGQGKVLATMRGLGAGRKKEIGHVFWTGADILIPGTILGTGAGMLLWQRGIQFLVERAGSTLALELDLPVFLGVSLCQLALALALTTILAIPMTADSGIKKRK